MLLGEPAENTEVPTGLSAMSAPSQGVAPASSPINTGDTNCVEADL